MDKAPAYGAGDSGFESQYGLFFARTGEKRKIKADLAEWLRRMLKAHVRKSVGSTPTVRTFPFSFRPVHSPKSGKMYHARGSNPRPID